MKTCLLVRVLALLVALSTAALAADDLVLNGSGVRTKMILGTMYDLSLNVPQSLKGAAGNALVEADQPMEFVLTIQSGLITRARFVEATTEGFAKAAAAGYPAENTKMFLDQFADIEFKPGDVIVMRYAPDGLSTLYRKPAAGETAASEKTLGLIPGLELKKALFAIWLGDAPVQASLKNGLLGKK
jgi:hypothetical protein